MPFGWFAHDAGDSDGTTLRRYCSSTTPLTTCVAPSPNTSRNVPRYCCVPPLRRQTDNIALRLSPGSPTDAVGSLMLPHSDSAPPQPFGRVYKRLLPSG